MSWDPGGAKRGGKVYLILRFLRIEQVLFSLPMAYMGAFLAIRGIPSLRVLLLTFSALFFLRMAGMTMDNLADREIDAANPRTRSRPLVTGAITIREAWTMIVVGMVGFFISAYFVNVWALLFSPLVGAIVLSYPFMKKVYIVRQLSSCHNTGPGGFQRCNSERRSQVSFHRTGGVKRPLVVRGLHNTMGGWF